MLPGGNSFSQAHPGPGQENPAAKRGWKSSGSNSRCGGIGEGRIRMDPCLGCAWRGIRAHSLFVPIPKLQQISDPQGKIWLQKLSASFPNSFPKFPNCEPKGKPREQLGGNSRDDGQEPPGHTTGIFWDVGELWGWNPGWNTPWNTGAGLG